MKKVSFAIERVVIKVLKTQHLPLNKDITNWSMVMDEHDPRSITAALKNHKLIETKYDPDLQKNYFVTTEAGVAYLAKYYPLIKGR